MTTVPGGTTTRDCATAAAVHAIESASAANIERDLMSTLLCIYQPPAELPPVQMIKTYTDVTGGCRQPERSEAVLTAGPVAHIYLASFA
jgi:hypothetical protein